MYYYSLHLKNADILLPEFFSEGVLCKILQVPTQWIFAFHVYLPMTSESARTCSFHITQKTALKWRWLLKIRQTKFMIGFYIPFASLGSLKHFSGCQGSTTPTQLQLQAEATCSLWTAGLPFPLLLLSLLAWLKTSSLAEAEVSTHAALHKPKHGGRTSRLT